MIEVSPGEIERALRRVWHEAAEQDAAADRETRESRVRAVLGNVVLLCAQGGDSVDELVTGLCVTNSSRFFIVRYDVASTEETLRTGVSSRCVLARSGAHVCSEEVYITVGPKGVQYIPSLLSSLFVPDVRTVAVSLGDVIPVLDKVRPLVDLLIYDSCRAANYFESVTPYSRIRSEQSEVRSRDLNWYRTEKLRMLIAEKFDGEGFSGAVHSIAKVTLTSVAVPHGSSHGICSKSLLLAGWFHVTLGWQQKSVKLHDNRVELISTSLDGIQVRTEFILDGATPSGADEYLSGIEIAIGENNPVIVSVRSDTGQARAQISVTGDLGQIRGADAGDISIRSIPLRGEPLEELILRPLQSSGINDYFTKSMERSLDIAALIAQAK